MSTTLYTDQLRDGLKQAREQLLAAQSLAAGRMNAAAAKLAQQTADSSDRAEARDLARALETVMRRTQYLAARVQHLGTAAAAAAAASDTASNGLIAALESVGRSVRASVEAKDSVLREVDGVAAVARNHLRNATPSGTSRDPLSALADEVATTLGEAGTAIERLQQRAVTAGIKAAQSLAAGAHERWRDASSTLDAVAKQAAAALADATTVATAALHSNDQIQVDRYSSWEQLNEGDHTSLAYLQGLREVDRVVNGNLQAGIQNLPGDRGPSAGLWASYRIEEPEVAEDPRAAEGAQKAPAPDRREVAFFAVPTASAGGFGRSAARDALALGQCRRVSADKSPAGEGRVAWTFHTPKAEPLLQDLAGADLQFGQSYTVFAAVLEPQSSSRSAASSRRRSGGRDIGRLSLGSLPVTAAIQFNRVRRPAVQMLPRGAFVVRFENVGLDGNLGPKVTLEDCVDHYRLLLLRDPVWQSWLGRLGGKGEESGPSPSPAEAARTAGESKATTSAPAAPKSKGSRESRAEEEAAAAEAPLEQGLAIAREIQLAGMLNEADWTVLQPSGVGSFGPDAKAESIAEAVARQFTADLAAVPGTPKALTPKDREDLIKFLGSGVSQGFVLAYFSPFAHLGSDASEPASNASRRRPGQGRMVIARYTDITGELIDLDEVPYVAVVQVVSKRQANNQPIAEDVISKPSKPFPAAP